MPSSRRSVRLSGSSGNSDMRNRSDPTAASGQKVKSFWICRSRWLASSVPLLLLVCALRSDALEDTSDAFRKDPAEDVGGDRRFCSPVCDCLGPEIAIQVDCSNRSLTEVPQDIKSGTVKLYLIDNKIVRLSDGVFRQLPLLNELNLANNNISNISTFAFTGLSKLRSLSLQNNRLVEVPSSSFESIPSVEALHLDGNQLSSIPPGSFSPLRRLQRLWLNGNQLIHVPAQALGDLADLEALNLGDNKIQSVPDFAFRNSTKLVILMLQRCEISYIGPKGFDGLTSLKVLEIHDNRLTELPLAVASLPTLRELVFSNNAITKLSSDSFRKNPKLTLLEMGGNPITLVGSRTFTNLPSLKKLTVSEAREMKTFPDLTGTGALEHLRLDRANLKHIPGDLCDTVPLLKSLNLKSNHIMLLPNLEGCKDLRLIDFSYNEIRSIDGAPFQYQNKLLDLHLSHNFIEYIPEEAFYGLENLQVLDLMKNRIEDIHSKAFANLTNLRDLNLGENIFSILPSEGLQNLRQLKTFNNRNLREFPLPEKFPKVHTLALSYAYHCCMFRPLARRLPLPASLKETIVWLTREDVDMTVWSTNITDVWPGYENFSTKFQEFASQLWKAFDRDYTAPDNLAQFTEEKFQNYKISHGAENSGQDKRPVQCLPEPGPFMPCEDLFGWWSLRCGVWVVFLLAMLGNGIVVIVLLFGRSKVDVPRFLVCNLAIADFFMGIYLGILAVVDASTLGEFREYAIQWQMSAGCQIAGFLGVLSSELSVYTLAVITLERNYAITHAMHLNKRLSLKHAAYIMGGGWTFALVMALLPLFGISDYRKFAVCLPFEIEDSFSMTYVVFVILINGVAFLTLMGCYLKMYWVIRGSQAWNSNDSRIAKRMALLVVTDFICWAPIAFFSLTAVFGVDLISLEEAKVFTIFVLPLNSCANPFLYAIFTKQFKKDCVLICKRIEESRVTRGIGRCRHSSNFSNRHTPANTNSAAERKSGGPVAGDNLPVCQCNAHLKVVDKSAATKFRRPQPVSWKSVALRYLTCHFRDSPSPDRKEYQGDIARLQKGNNQNHKRGSSISSENFSSRSDSWRQGQIPLRLLERGARRNSWTCTQKLSQDSSNSCSRQDSSTSTFRMSRSSVSSDASSSRVSGRSSARDRAPSTKVDKVHGNVNGDLPVLPRLLRASTTAGNLREKPKLCRQGAIIDEACQMRQMGRDASVALNKSPPSIPPKRTAHGVCTTCGRRETLPSLRFKSKELEDKFNCFYNRLVETSHEESSEGATSKDEHVVSTDQSTGDAKTDSGKETVDTSLSEQPSDDFDLLSPIPREPPILDFGRSGSKIISDTNTAVISPPNYGAQVTSSTITPGVTGPCNIAPLIQSPSVHISSEAMSKSKSHSMSNLGFEFKLFSRRKAVSDNSLKKISLKSLPAFLRSLSSQSTHSTSQKPLNVGDRSHSNLLPIASRPIPSCRSELTIAPNRSPDSSCTAVWTPNGSTHLSDRVKMSYRDVDSGDEEDDADTDSDEEDSSTHHTADQSAAKVTSTPDLLPLCVTNSTTSEDSPLIDKEVRPPP